NLWIEMRGDRKCQPHIHSAGVPLYWGIEKCADAREINDLIELGIDLSATHAEDRTVQINILSARQLGMESGTDLKQTGQSSTNAHRSVRRIGDSGYDFE